MKQVVIIFVRHPEMGKVKTRLAAQIGEEATLVIYKKLLQHTLQITAPLQAAKAVFYVDAIIDNDLWNKEGYYKFLQRSGDLGDKMQSAFEEVLNAGYKKAVIIGSDCYELDATTIETAFTALDHHDVVIGPAKDGGYYLLGMKKVYKDLFENKTWSTASVFEETFAAIHQLHLTYFQLPVLSDVDEAADLPASLKEEVSHLILPYSKPGV